MSSAPDPKEFHKRAGASAKDTRETIIKLSTGALGVFAFIATRTIEPALTMVDVVALWVSIVLTVLALGTAILLGFADAQWAVSWDNALAREGDRKANAERERAFWHGIKRRAEKAMLVFFVLAAAAMGAFLYFRTLALMA